MSSGEMSFTAGGNVRSPSYELLCTWIVNAWSSITKEMIVNSFKCCGISIALDGTEDNLISCFKHNTGCEIGLEILQKSILAEENDAILEETPAEEQEIVVDSIELDDSEDEIIY